MPCKKIIVVTTYHLRVDDLWDIWESSVLKHSLDILSLLRKICSSEFLCFLVFVLQFGQLQSHISDVGNVRTVSSYLALKGVLELVELGKDSCSAYEDLIEREELTWVDQKTRLWLVRTAGGARSWCFLLRRSFPPQHSAEGIETRHRQLR